MKEFMEELKKANLVELPKDYCSDIDFVYKDIMDEYRKNIGKDALLIEDKEICVVKIYGVTNHTLLLKKPIVHTRGRKSYLSYINIAVSYNSIICNSSTVKVVL